jgi:RimJ/RimL family protein N-acetyltransferase
MIPAISIQTPRLVLRPFRESDLDDLTRIHDDAEVTRFLGEGKPISRDTTWRQIAMFLGHAQIRGYSMMAIEDRATGALLGRCGPWFPEGWPMLEVGWLVDRSRRGQGIATEAGRAAVDWCFAQLAVSQVCSLIRPDNAASARVAAKLGARVERQLDNFFGGVADVWVHHATFAGATN